MFQTLFPAVWAEADRLARSHGETKRPRSVERRAPFGRRAGGVVGVEALASVTLSSASGAPADGVRSAFLADVRRVAESHASASMKHAMLIDLLQHYRDGFLSGTR